MPTFTKWLCPVTLWKCMLFFKINDCRDYVLYSMIRQYKSTHLSFCITCRTATHDHFNYQSIHHLLCKMYDSGEKCHLFFWKMHLKDIFIPH